VGAIEVDRSQLIQVLSNLITNPRDAMSKGGTITVRTADRHGCDARIGPYSYAVFLFHLFFTGGSRQLMQHAAGIYDPYVLFAVGMLAGLIGPIVLQRAVLRRPVLAWALLGQRQEERDCPWSGWRGAHDATSHDQTL
jgi:hypothetical protein